MWDGGCGETPLKRALQSPLWGHWKFFQGRFCPKSAYIHSPLKIVGLERLGLSPRGGKFLHQVVSAAMVSYSAFRDPRLRTAKRMVKQSQAQFARDCRKAKETGNFADVDRQRKLRAYDKRNSWCTPVWLRNLITQRWNITLDAACNPSNRLLSNGDFKTKADAPMWKTPGVVFCNPPYSELTYFLTTAVANLNQGFCKSVVMLLPRPSPTMARGQRCPFFWKVCRQLASAVYSFDVPINFEKMNGHGRRVPGPRNAPFYSHLVVLRKHSRLGPTHRTVRTFETKQKGKLVLQPKSKNPKVTALGVES